MQHTAELSRRVPQVGSSFVQDPRRHAEIPWRGKGGALQFCHEAINVGTAVPQGLGKVTGPLLLPLGAGSCNRRLVLQLPLGILRLGNLRLQRLPLGAGSCNWQPLPRTASLQQGGTLACFPGRGGSTAWHPARWHAAGGPESGGVPATAMVRVSAPAIFTGEAFLRQSARPEPPIFTGGFRRLQDEIILHRGSLGTRRRRQLL